MAQAEATPTTSRRSFLAVAASAAALTSAAAPAKGAVPDAELIALGRQMDALLQTYEIAQLRLRPFYDEHQIRMDDWVKANPVGTYVEAHGRIVSEIGLDKAEKDGPHPDDLMNQLGPIERSIMAIPAVSLAGLSVKARLAKFAADDCWLNSEAATDWDKLAVRKLVDAVIMLAATA